MMIRRPVQASTWTFSSEDFAAGELITHAQSCLWITGHSELAIALLHKVDPHSAFAATILGVSYEEFIKRKKEPKFKNARQAAKPPGFGYPGGMGSAKLVAQQRKQGPDTPCERGPSMIKDGDKMVRGYKGLRFCILMGYAEECGLKKLKTWGKYSRRIDPTCEQCLEAAEHLKALWRQQWPENGPYFEYVNQCVDSGMVITGEMLERWPHLKEWYYEDQQLAPGEIMQHVSGRIRQVATRSTESPFCSAANGFFQGLLADIAKAAHRQITRECYDPTIVVPEYLHHNSVSSAFSERRSPLFGSRVPVFQHDEVICEHPSSVAHEASARVSEVMCDKMRWYCPDLADAAAAEQTLMRRWYKSAEKVVHHGRVVPWEPGHDSKTCVECAA